MIQVSIDHVLKKGPWGENRQRLLFMPESASLAHMGRLLTLAQGLPLDRFDITFACDQSLQAWVPPSFQWKSSSSLSPIEFRDRLDRGRPLLDENLISKQVAEDLALFHELRPSIVIGDFRPSLAISAPLAGIHYVNVVNAHWSPWSPLPLKVPGALNTWWCRPLGHRVGKHVVETLLPIGFRLQARPFNTVCRSFGLPPFTEDIRYIYAAGDTVVYPDLPTLSPTPGAPESHHHIGPLLWEPEIPLPLWWDTVPKDRPCVSVSVGSTGSWAALERVVEALRQLPVVTLVATSGRGTIEPVPNQIYVADYLPGMKSCQRADLVICNGGAGTVYQALSQGVPVLGIAANMDQMSVMTPIEKLGAGRCIPVGIADRVDWARAVSSLLSSAQSRVKAQTIARIIGGESSSAAFQNILFKEITRISHRGHTPIIRGR